MKIRNEELNRLSEGDFRKSKKLNAVIILDQVRSAMNVGSVFRSSDAFRAKKIYLCGITAKPPHREINKTALGAQNVVEWEYQEKTVEVIHRLKAQDYRIVVVEQADESTSLLSFDPYISTPHAFVFGNEVFGVSDEVIALADNVLEIPQFGTKHSLNISVCVGIVVWDFLSKQKSPLAENFFVD